MKKARIYKLLFPDELTFKKKNIILIINQFLIYIIQAGLGTLIIIMLSTLDLWTSTNYEQITELFIIFILVLLMCSTLFFMKGMFIIFSTGLFLAIFIQNNFYYPIWTLIMSTMFWLSALPRIFEYFKQMNQNAKTK